MLIFVILWEKSVFCMDLFYKHIIDISEPSPPKVIEVRSPDPHSLFIRWLTSETPNGIITKYRLYLEWYPDSEETLRQRNFCNTSKRTFEKFITFFNQ